MDSKKMSIKGLRKLMEERIVRVPMSEADVLRLHAVGVLMDGRSPMAKMIKKRITPVALEILKNRPEYE